MKKLFILPFTALFLLTNTSFAQQRIKEKDILGTWKMVINIDEGFEDAKNSLDGDENSFIGKLILNSVEGAVSTIIDELDIYMTFQKGGDLKIVVDAFDEKEVEYSSWEISKDGVLTLDNDNSDADHWIMKDEILVGHDEDGDKNYAYMVRIN